jgi:hypothetical protein
LSGEKIGKNFCYGLFSAEFSTFFAAYTLVVKVTLITSVLPCLGRRPSASTPSSAYTSKFFFICFSSRTRLNLLNFTKTSALCGQHLDNSLITWHIQGIGLAGTHSPLHSPFIFSLVGKDTRKEFT